MSDVENEIKKIHTDFETLSELKRGSEIDPETDPETDPELKQIKLNILRQYKSIVFLKDKTTYVQAKKILNKINLYRMILDIYIFSKGDNTLINTAWGTRADIKVSHLFYMVLEWFESMKNKIPNNKICELNPVEANAFTDRLLGKSYLNVSRSSISCDTALNISFTEKLSFLKNYNSLIQETVFTNYYTYLNNTYGKGERVNELTGKGNDPRKVFQAFNKINNGKNKYIENNDDNITGLDKYDLGETLINPMTTHFFNITKGYNGNKKPQYPNDIDKALVYARYIDVIQILKEKKDYKVDGPFMKESIKDYIQDGNQGALNYIKSRKDNEYIKQ